MHTHTHTQVDTDRDVSAASTHPCGRTFQGLIPGVVQFYPDEGFTSSGGSLSRPQAHSVSLSLCLLTFFKLLNSRLNHSVRLIGMVSRLASDFSICSASALQVRLTKRSLQFDSSGNEQQAEFSYERAVRTFSHSPRPGLSSVDTGS